MFRIDPKSGVPFYRQIIEQVKFGVARGELVPGQQLPTVRHLAVEDPSGAISAVVDKEALIRSPRYAPLVVLRDIEGLDYADIAVVLDLPPGTVKSRLHRALAALRGRLGS